MRVAVCYSGEMRWARFVQRNHMKRVFEPLINVYHAEIDFYVVTSYSNSYRALKNENLTWEHRPVDERVIHHFTQRLRAFGNVKVIRVLETAPQVEERYNLFSQFQKLRHVLTTIPDGYEFVIRLRPDIYFDVDVQLPANDQVLSNKEEVHEQNITHEYNGDAVQIFPGERLKSLVKWCDAIRPEDIPSNRFRFYENVVVSMFSDCGLRHHWVSGMGSRWYAITSRYFEGIDWRYFGDWHSVEYALPFSRTSLDQAMSRSGEAISDLKATLVSLSIDSEPVWVQKVILSALRPSSVEPSDHPLNEFAKSLVEYDCVGVVPCAGTASRIDGISKFLLPVPPRDTLVKRVLNYMADMDKILVGTSQQNSIYFPDPIIVGSTATMSETVKKTIAGCPSKGYLLMMPDTYFTGVDWNRVRDLMDSYLLVVVVWKIRPDQYGKLGQCEVRGNQVVAHRDKDPTCKYEYSWGVIGWHHSLNHLIDPATPHVGYLIDAALTRGIQVGAYVSEGEYYDCGTFDEYFRLIRHLVSE